MIGKGATDCTKWQQPWQPAGCKGAYRICVRCAILSHRNSKASTACSRCIHTTELIDLTSSRPSLSAIQRAHARDNAHLSTMSLVIDGAADPPHADTAFVSKPQPHVFQATPADQVSDALLFAAAILHFRLQHMLLQATTRHEETIFTTSNQSLTKALLFTRSIASRLQQAPRAHRPGIPALHRSILSPQAQLSSTALSASCLGVGSSVMGNFSARNQCRLQRPVCCPLGRPAGSLEYGTCSTGCQKAISSCSTSILCRTSPQAPRFHRWPLARPQSRNEAQSPKALAVAPFTTRSSAMPPELLRRALNLDAFGRADHSTIPNIIIIGGSPALCSTTDQSSSRPRLHDVPATDRITIQIILVCNLDDIRHICAIFANPVRIGNILAHCGCPRFQVQAFTSYGASLTDEHLLRAPCQLSISPLLNPMARNLLHDCSLNLAQSCCLCVGAQGHAVDIRCGFCSNHTVTMCTNCFSFVTTNDSFVQQIRHDTPGLTHHHTLAGGRTAGHSKLPGIGRRSTDNAFANKGNTCLTASALRCLAHNPLCHPLDMSGLTCSTPDLAGQSFV